MHLADRVARPFRDRHPRFAEDITLEANLALCGAAADFDDHMDIKFATFVINRVKFAILDYLRLNMPLGYRRIKGKTAKSSQIGFESIDAMKFDGLGDEFDGFSDVDSLDFYNNILGYLNVRERRIVDMHIAGGKEHKEIASKFGVGESWIGYLYRSAINQLRGNFRVGLNP